MWLLMRLLRLVRISYAQRNCLFKTLHGVSSHASCSASPKVALRSGGVQHRGSVS
jgi:hypothetical protein